MSSRRFGLITLLFLLLVSGCAPAAPQPARVASPAPETAVVQSEDGNRGISPAPAPATSPRSSAAEPAFTATAPATVTPGAAAAASRPEATPTPIVTTAPPATASATATPALPATPGPTPDGVPRQARVPILMYHYVSQPPDDADVYRRDLSVPPERFASHLVYLHDAGYQVITLDDLLYALVRGRPLPEKPVILTFDDGYVDNYTEAFPLLQKYGFVGHFFLITDFVNQGRPGYLSWAQIEEMSRAGQRFGSHSRDHPDLRGRPTDYLVWEALGSTESIQEHLGYHPRWVAYPSGRYDSQTIAVYRSANYWGGLTTEQGATHTTGDLFELRRVRVRGNYTAEDLARLLTVNW